MLYLNLTFFRFLVLGVAAGVVHAPPKTAAEFCKRGWRHFDSQRFELAQADFAAAVRLDSKSADAYAGRGLATLWVPNLDMEQEFSNAVHDFNEAIRLDPKCADAYAARGTANRMKADYDSADFDSANYGSPNYDLAIRDFTESLLYKPKYRARILWSRATCYIAHGKPDKAIADCSEAVRVDPKFPCAYTLRGWLYFNKGDLDNAIADFTSSIRLESKSAEAYYWRARAYGALEKYDECIKDCSRAIKIGPEYTAAYTLRCAVNCAKEDYAAVIVDATTAIRLGEQDQKLLLLRGFAYQSIGQNEKAIVDLTEALRVVPEFAPGIYECRGKSFYQTKQYAKAIADYSESIRLEPESVASHEGLARIYASCAEKKYRNGKKAIVHATKAYELSGGSTFNDGPNELLADAYAEAGDQREAVKWRTKTAKATSEQPPRPVLYPQPYRR